MGYTDARTRILLLGPVEVHVERARMPPRSRRQRVLLARLALGESAVVPTDVLIDDLWGDQPPRDAAHALQAHVHRLRKQFFLDIEFTANGYRLDASALKIDAHEFTELHARGLGLLDAGDADGALQTLEWALELWRGPALGDLADDPGLRLSALHFDELRRVAVHDRAEAALTCGRGAQVVDDLRTSLSEDPLRESSWHQLMRALRQAGREAEALAAYSSAQAVFIEELGASPGTSLAELHRALLESPTSDSADPAEQEITALPHDAVGNLIGRRREFATLARAWSDSREGLQVVTISGEPGIGKTRLASAVSDALLSRGVTTLRARCSVAAAPTFGVFAQLLRAFLTTHEDDGGGALVARTPELARILPGLEEHIENDDQPTHLAIDHHRTMDALAGWLSEVTHEHPALIVIDDVQWADHQSLIALQHLIDSPRRIRALVIVCMRDRELHAAAPLADMLRQSDRVYHLPLKRFSEQEGAALVDAEVARLTELAQLPVWGRDYILGASGGNPLFTLELTRQLLMEESPTADIPPPPIGVSRVIEDRIGILRGSTRMILRLLAVLGPASTLEFARDAGIGTADELETAVAEAVHYRLIDRIDGERIRYAFSHEVVRAVLYDGLPTTDRARIHAQTATALEERARKDPSSVDHRLLAHHYARSDLPDRAARAGESLLAAATEALERGAPTDAEALLGDARGFADHRAQASVRCDILIALGTAQQQLARPEYRETLLDAARLAKASNDPRRLTEAVLANNRGWWSNTSAIDHERIEYLDIALAHCPHEDQSSRAKLLAAWALENVRDTSAREVVLDVASEALRIAEASEDPYALALVLSHRYAVMHALFADPAECAAMNERLLELSHRLGDRQMRLSAAVGMAQATMRIGEYTIADRYLNQALHLAQARGDLPRLWLLRSWQAMRETTRGNVVEAERLAGEALALGVDSGQADAQTWFAGQLFTMRMLDGRLHELIEEVSEQAQALFAAIPAWQAALALVLARSGRRDEATSIIDHFAADEFDGVPRDMLWLNAMHYFALVCEELSLEQHADTIYRLLIPYEGLVATNGTIDAGPVDLYLGILARTQGRHGPADAHLASAEAFATSSGSRAWQTQVRLRARPADTGVA